MNLTLYTSFLASSFLLAILPGPDNIFVLTESLSKGARQGILITTGLVSGVLVHTLLAALGISAVMYSSALVFSAFKVACSVYLLYLAFRTVSEPAIMINQLAQSALTNASALYRQGLMMNVSNPKVGIFFLALLPQFVDGRGFPPVVQMTILGISFMVVAFCVFCGIALTAGYLKILMVHPRFNSFMKWVKVTVLTTLAIGLWFN